MVLLLEQFFLNKSAKRARGQKSHNDEEPSDGQPALSDAPVGVHEGVAAATVRLPRA